MINSSRVWARAATVGLFYFLTTSSMVLADDQPYPSTVYFHLRGSLQNSALTFDKTQKGNVAFLGGSITEMNGYRPIVADFLTKQFPKTKFTFTNAGISSTCSTTGAFRLNRDVLSKGPVDLIFVDFAVNDDQDAHHAPPQCIRGIEGIIRRLRTAQPRADIVLVQFVNPDMLALNQKGKNSISVDAQEKVAKHYNISSVQVGPELAKQILEKKLTWKQYGGVHPKKPGNQLAANMVIALLNKAWAQTDANPEIKNHKLPKPLDPLSYGTGDFLSPEKATNQKGWAWSTPDWKKCPGNCRKRFVGEKLLHTEQAGATLSLSFTGSAIGAFVLAGPDAGMVNVTVDGKQSKTVDLYHDYSKNLHYPRTVMFFDDLPAGPHTLTLEVLGRHNKASKGHAVRILQFAVNGTNDNNE